VIPADKQQNSERECADLACGVSGIVQFQIKESENDDRPAPEQADQSENTISGDKARRRLLFPGSFAASNAAALVVVEIFVLVDGTATSRSAPRLCYFFNFLDYFDFFEFFNFLDFFGYLDFLDLVGFHGGSTLRSFVDDLEVVDDLKVVDGWRGRLGRSLCSSRSGRSRRHRDRLATLGTRRRFAGGGVDDLENRLATRTGERNHRRNPRATADRRGENPDYAAYLRRSLSRKTLLSAVTSQASGQKQRSTHHQSLGTPAAFIAGMSLSKSSEPVPNGL
jgi:hypothetical protein